MVKLSKSLIAIFFIVSFLSNIISCHAGNDHDHEHDHEHEHDHDHDVDHDHNHNHSTEDDVNGNLLDEGGMEIIESLGYHRKLNINKDEMKLLLEKVIFKKEAADIEEQNFYNKIISNMLAALPEEILMSEIRHYFEVEYMMKFIDESVIEEQLENENHDNKDL